MASDLLSQVLDTVSQADGPILSNNAFPTVDFTTIKSALDRLGSREMITHKQIDREEANLTPEAEEIAAQGSHEAKVFEAVRQAVDGLKIADLPGVVGKESAKIGQGKAFKEGWIKKDKDLLKATTSAIHDASQDQLRTIQQTKTHPDSKVLSDLRKRKLITMQKVITFEIMKGPKFSREFVKEETDLTADMLATWVITKIYSILRRLIYTRSGSWKTVKLKPYNFNAMGAPTMSGALHPLNKVRHEFRQIFFEMGFEEMPTNRYVETGFWKFDALFVPQQHPARDLQDTFYIADPSVADTPRADPVEKTEQLADGSTRSHKSQDHPNKDYEKYWNNIKEVHEK
ncbi:MAG: hypothetical protein Q9198_008150, partial [Flavoplaca austrocitrina]